MLSDNAASANSPVAVYKSLLRDIVNRRPSGTRQKIAAAIGKHKSFVSQITNPNYAMPVPAKHLGAILDLCHCSSRERKQLLDAYARAHPARVMPEQQSGDDGVTISIRLPALRDRRRQTELASVVRRFAAEVGALARKWDETDDKGGGPR